jgi:hypothetical protein
LVFINVDSEIRKIDIHKLAKGHYSESTPVLREKISAEFDEPFETFCVEESGIIALTAYGEIHWNSINFNHRYKTRSLAQYLGRLPDQQFTTIQAIDGLLFTSSVAVDIYQEGMEIATISMVGLSTLKPINTITFKYDTFGSNTSTRNPIHQFSEIKNSSLVIAHAYASYIFLINCKNNKLSIQDCWCLSNSRAKIFSVLILDRLSAVVVSYQSDISTSVICLLPMIKL